MSNTFSKRDVFTLVGVVASVIVPKLLFDNGEIVEIIEPVDIPEADSEVVEAPVEVIEDGSDG